MIKKAYIMPHPPIIVPEIGGVRQKDALITVEGCQRAAHDIFNEAPDTIVIISPHGPSYSNVVCIAGDSSLKGDFGSFGHSKMTYEFQNDTVLAELISKGMEESGIYTVINDNTAQSEYGIDPSLDHGALVPLYFVQKEYRDFKLVHMATALPGAVELYTCGMAIQKAATAYGKKVLLIASSDLSHRLTDDGPYEYAPEGAEYDRFVVNSIKNKEFAEFLDVNLHMRECAGECGHRAISIATGLFENFTCNTTVYSYEGPFGVGYMNALISIEGFGPSVLKQYKEIRNIKAAEARKNESHYVRLARKTIEQYIKTGKIPKPAKTGDERRATFVSIKKNGRLRGCIGTISPTTDCVENEIIDNAIKAATEDPRFSPITEDELQELTISVDVLFEPEKIKSRDMLDVREYGVIVTKGLKRGLLLPNLEGIDTVEEQINIALKKGGIASDENYTMERFKVVRHE